VVFGGTMWTGGGLRSGFGIFLLELTGIDFMVEIFASKGGLMSGSELFSAGIYFVGLIFGFECWVIRWVEK
jgi:hypothetical protein